MLWLAKGLGLSAAMLATAGLLIGVRNAVGAGRLPVHRAHADVVVKRTERVESRVSRGRGQRRVRADTGEEKARVRDIPKLG